LSTVSGQRRFWIDPRVISDDFFVETRIRLSKAGSTAVAKPVGLYNAVAKLNR
jgi:hypothetical protein